MVSLAEVGDDRDHLGELVGVVEVDREEAVVAGGAAQRLDASGERPRPRPARPAAGPVGAGTGCRRRCSARRGGAPARRTRRRRGSSSDSSSIAAAPAVVELLAGLGQLVAEAVAAEADAEDEPAAAEPVQRRGLPGDLGRPAAGEGRDHGAEPHPFGGGGDRRQRDPRVGHLPDRRPPAQVVPDEDPVPAGLLRLGGQTGDHGRVGELVEERQPQRRTDSAAAGPADQRHVLLSSHLSLPLRRRGAPDRPCGSTNPAPATARSSSRQPSGAGPRLQTFSTEPTHRCCGRTLGDPAGLRADR